MYNITNDNALRRKTESSKYDLVALMDVEASCFKDTPQVLTCAVDRHVANENKEEALTLKRWRLHREETVADGKRKNKNDKNEKRKGE